MTPRSTWFPLGIHALGATMLAAHVALAVLSYAQAAALWSEETFPRASAFFLRLAGTAGFGLGFGRDAALITNAVLQAIATVTAMATILLLTRAGDRIDAATPRLLLRWSIAFAIVNLAAFPVFTQDFWLSAAWGRMVAAGLNPFHALFGPAELEGLPLDHFPMVMSYGPLWATLSALVALLTAGHVVAMAVLFKLLLGACFIGALVVVERLHAEPSARSLGIALFGWLPLPVSQSLAEGHNDIVMIAPALLWLLLLQRRSVAAPFALAVSVLCKYATAPLFLVDAIAALRRDRLSFTAYARRMLGPALLAAVVTAVFFRSPAFFDGVRLISEWRFLRPADALTGLEQLLSISLPPLPVVAQCALPIYAVYQLAAAAADPGSDRLSRAAVAVIAAILFGALSHLWPWYLVWGAAFAAALPQWWLARFIAGVALFIPFTLSIWWVPSFEPWRDVATLAVYAAAGLWVYASRAPRPAGGPFPGRAFCD